LLINTLFLCLLVFWLVFEIDVSGGVVVVSRTCSDLYALNDDTTDKQQYR
jgi:hypothetical protein